MFVSAVLVPVVPVEPCRTGKVEKSCDVILGLQASEDDLLDQPQVASWDEVERQITEAQLSEIQDFAVVLSQIKRSNN